MDLILTTRCNGGCKHCSNLMYLYDEHNCAYDLDPKRVIANLDRAYPYIQKFSEHDVDEMSRGISIIGGEPFIYDGLVEICKFLVTQKWWKWFRLWTNGSVIPDWFEDLLDVMETDDRFEVITGNYEWSCKQDEIISRCRERGIEANKRCIGWTEYCNPEKDKIGEKTWDSCPIRAIIVYGDRLYPCSRIAHLHELGLVEPKKGEYLDIWKDDLSQVENWTQDFTDCCKFCGVGSGDMEEIKAGE